MGMNEKVDGELKGSEEEETELTDDEAEDAF